MNWKGRQMFSPINMTKGGGVPYPSYEGGGIIGATPRERKRMFTIWDKMTQGQKEKVMDGKRYQTGGEIMPTQLFEEGDQDINMALNNMVGTTSPSIGQLSEEISFERETMGEEPRTMDIKEKYKNILRQYASQLSETEEEIGRLWEQVKKVEVAYANELKEAGQEITAENQLITEEFLQELETLFSSAIPAMQAGSVVKDSESAMLERLEALKEIKDLGIQLPLDRWMEIRKDPTAKQKVINIFSLMTAQQQQGTQAQTDLMNRISDIVGERQGLAKTISGATTTQAQQIKDIFEKRRDPAHLRDIGAAAGAQAVTKGGGFGSFLAQNAAARGAIAATKEGTYADQLKYLTQDPEAAEAMLKDAILKDELAALNRTMTGAGGVTKMPAAVMTDLYETLAPTDVTQTDVDEAWEDFQRGQKIGTERTNTFNDLGNFINTFAAVPSVFIGPHGLGGTIEMAGNTIDFASYFKTKLPSYRDKWSKIKSSQNTPDVETGLVKKSNRTVMPMEYAWILAKKEWQTLKAST